MTLERALFHFHARDFGLWHRGITWEENVRRLVALYDLAGWWHVLPESVLDQREAWRNGTARTEYAYDEATGAFARITLDRASTI